MHCTTEIVRQAWKTTIVIRRLIGLIGVVSAIGGCSDSPSQRRGIPDKTTLKSQDSPSADRFLAARQSFRSGDYDSAAKTIQALLLEDPDDRDAILIAAQIEAARGRPKFAIELAQSIPIDDERLGERAAKLCYEQSVKSGNDSAVESVLRGLIRQAPRQPDWRRKLILILNRQGRRREACEQADVLCRSGQADAAELLSLIRRTDAFPAELPRGKDPSEVFAAGLGLARWHFTAKEYEQGLKQIETELGKPNPNRAATIALQGRLFAETQSFEQIHAWHRSCDDAVKAHGDYWAAIGLFLIQSDEKEGAARAFLEAIQRNRTDRISYQRLAQVMDALGRSDDAEQFRQRGIAISKTQRFPEQLVTAPTPELQQSLSRALIELGRPFEALGWATLALPSAARREQLDFDTRRQSLLANKRIDELMIANALSGLDPAHFKIDEALSRRLGRLSIGNSSNIAVLQRPKPTEILAMPSLTNVASEVGADFQWYNGPEIDVSSLPIYQSLGGGIAVIDYDLDGWPDLYFAQGSGVAPNQGTRSNQLLRNIRGTFHDVTERSASSDYGYASGLAAGDLNQDGFPDLVIGNLGGNRLLINNGDGSFSDATDRFGPHEARFTSSLAIADITGDALPDVFESNYIEMEHAFDPLVILPNGKPQQPSPLLHYAESDRWFRSLGDGRFELLEIDESVAKPGSSLGVVVTDFDGKVGNEVFVGNDARPNHYLFYEGGTLFRNRADVEGIANGFHGSANACMGIASGDFNRDGTIDLQIANFVDEPANLYLQTSGGGFVDSAFKYGIGPATTDFVGFGTKALDIDRNGWLDFIITNGHVFDMRDTGAPFKMPPQVFMGIGSHYEMISQGDLSDYFGGNYLGRTIAMLDFDRDGAIDFVVGHLEHPTALLRNETTTPGNWVQLELVGTTSERDAIGAVVQVHTPDNQVFKQWVTAGDGYFASDEPLIDLGLGNASGIQQVIVRWPSGQQQTFDDISPGHRYMLVENEPKPTLR